MECPVEGQTSFEQLLASCLERERTINASIKKLNAALSKAHIEHKVEIKELNEKLIKPQIEHRVEIKELNGRFIKIHAVYIAELKGMIEACSSPCYKPIY